MSLDTEGEWSFQALLWQRARDVVVWAGTSPEGRADLFLPGPGTWQVHAEREATEIKALAGPIRVLSALVRYPDVVHPEDVSTACMEISHWAEANHLVETALNFAEAAGIANPWSSQAAAHAGQLCAQYATDDRAEIWYERAIKVGRRIRDWEWYIRSNLRLGLLRYEQGRFRESRRCQSRARSKALWAGFPAFAGQAHHALLLIEIAGGTFRGGDRHARMALGYYPIHYVRLPHLAHDYAVLLSCWGFDRLALELLDPIQSFITPPQERIAVVGTIARAAAGIGDITRHHAAADDVVLLAAISDRNAAGALALASEGAQRLCDWPRAEQLASRAQDVATRRREREPLRRARLVLDAVTRMQVYTPPSPLPDPEHAAETTALFLSRLAALPHAPPTDAGVHSRARTELTRFTIAGR